MTNHKKVSEDIKKQYHLWGTISEYVNIIDAYLATVKVLKKLSISYMRTTQPLESMVDTKPEHTLRSGIRFPFFRCSLDICTIINNYHSYLFYIL